MKVYVVMAGSLMKRGVYVRPIAVGQTRKEARQIIDGLAKKKSTDYWIHTAKG